MLLIGSYQVKSPTALPPLVAWLHLGQTEVLVDFQALLAGVAADKLDRRVRQAQCRQPRQHLMPEQVGVDAFGDAGCVYSWTICCTPRLLYGRDDFRTGKCSPGSLPGTLLAPSGMIPGTGCSGPC